MYHSLWLSSQSSTLIRQHRLQTHGMGNQVPTSTSGLTCHSPCRGELTPHPRGDFDSNVGVPACQPGSTLISPRSTSVTPNFVRSLNRHPGFVPTEILALHRGWGCLDADSSIDMDVPTRAFPYSGTRDDPARWTRRGHRDWTRPRTTATSMVFASTTTPGATAAVTAEDERNSEMPTRWGGFATLSAGAHDVPGRTASFSRAAYDRSSAVTSK